MMTWWARLKARFAKPGPSPTEAGEAGPQHPPPVIGEQSGAHGGADPAPLHHGRRRLKETYTSHWDLDYLPRDEVEKIAEKNRTKND